VITGIDKSGKETHAFNPDGLAEVTSAKDYLAKMGYNPLTINLPSYDTQLGSLVSAYLRRPSDIQLAGSLDPEYAWILWSLDRVQHLNKVRKWLRKPGNVLLAKRWLESHLVYQSAMGIDYTRILKFEANVIKQGYTITLDVPVKESLARKGSSDKDDLYETEKTLQEVRNRYLNLPSLYPYGSCYIIDASRSLKDVNQDLIAVLASLPTLA
jgi:dTMP kinase